MRFRLLIIALTAFCSISTFAHPNSADTTAKGTFVLHKFQQAIGYERYYILQSGNNFSLSSDFKFNDRGQDVPLQTSLTFNKEGKPLHFKINGKTSRTSVINSEVTITRDSALISVNEKITKAKLPANYFTISGYSPVAVQMQLIKYWKSANKPEHLKVFPAGEVRIHFEGFDNIEKAGRSEKLERYFIKGLIWGSEILWTDTSGNLVALFTNDAEGDKFEAVEQSYLANLPQFIGKAANYGMQSFKLPSANTETLYIKNANIVNVTTGAVLNNGVILIDKGVIANIGSAKEIKVPKKASVLDVKGQYALPGLWDMHAHFQQVEWGPAYLAAGVTTVRDCGNEFDFINAVDQAIESGSLGPRIIKAGIVDGDSPFALGIIRANNERDASDVVKRYKDNGFDQIKIYSSVKLDVLKAIAVEAKKLNLTVTGHIPQGITLVDGINAGMNQVNHIQFVYRAMLKSREQQTLNLEDSLPQQILKMLKEKNVVVDPTLGIYEWILRPLDQPLDAFEPGVRYLSEDLKEIFRNTGLPPEEAKKRETFQRDLKAIVFAMHKMGIPIVAGTDMMVPGYSLHREIELYQIAGLTPLQALQSATITPARVMGMDKNTGTLEAGKFADMIFVEQNPLENISNIRNIKTIVKDGKVYSPSALRQLVDFKP